MQFSLKSKNLYVDVNKRTGLTKNHFILKPYNVIMMTNSSSIDHYQNQNFSSPNKKMAIA